MTAEPILYVFAISHYCEKARWALDYFGIRYRLKHMMPGMNRRIAKKLGAESGSLPFLETGGGVVAGSAAIIDWGEQHRAAGKPSLNGENPVEVAAIEKRLDDITGVHIRRYYYSDALFSDPASVRPIFSRDLPLMQKALVTLGWSKIVPIMIKGMDLGEAQGLRSYHKLATELDWLDELLADGRPYLTGDSFTRADLTAASLLAPLVNPAKHPTYAALSLPKRLAETIRDWQDRPVLQWVSAVYERHR
jgi:glutathione S-transferase